MTTPEILDRSQDLIAIESTADNPEGLRSAYEYMFDLVRHNGPPLTIEEFENGGRPSFLAYSGEQRPERFDLIMNAHVDVVPGKPEQFKPYIEGGRLFGRGAYDMKVAALVMATVFSEYVNLVPYNLGFQLVTSEESGGAMGTGYQIEQGVRSDLVICGECGRAEDAWEIATEAKGIAAVQFDFSGAAAHSAYPWLGNNAGAKAVTFAAEVLADNPIPASPTGETTVTLTEIHSGGTAHNQIPDAGVVGFDCRYMPGDPRFRDKEAIAKYFRSINPDVEIAQYLSYGPPAYADPDHPFVQLLKSAAEHVEGHKFSFVRRNGASDGRFFSGVGGNAVEFGIAGRNSHARNESVSTAAVENYLQTMRAFLRSTLTKH